MARYLLGAIAEKHGSPAAAVRFWQGIATPPNVGAEEWQLRLAAAQWGAGLPDASLATVRALAKAGKPLPPAAADRAVGLAREMRDAGRPELAQEALSALLPLAGRAQSRSMLLALGQIAESGGRHAQAADYYLRGALANGTATTTAPRATAASASAGVASRT